VKLPPRKRVKIEQEAEEVSTVVTGKVVVSTMGISRIVGRSELKSEQKTGLKLLDKTRTGSAPEKGGVKQKKTSTTAGIRQAKATKQQGETVRKASKSSQHSSSKQPRRKKIRLA